MFMRPAGEAVTVGRIVVTYVHNGAGGVVVDVDTGDAPIVVALGVLAIAADDLIDAADDRGYD